MMNDTTNLTAQEKATLTQHLLMHRAYPELNPQPQGEATMNVTMHEEPATTPAPTPTPDTTQALILQVFSVLDNYIQTQVDRRFAHLVANTKALSLMDEELKNTITELIDDAITSHCQYYDHAEFTTPDHVSSQINDEVDDHIRHYLNHADHDLVTKNELHELVRDTLDEQLDEAIERKIDNATISISL